MGYDPGKRGGKTKMKVYEKPRICIERFELSQHIAACAWDMTNQSSEATCEATADTSWNLPAGLTMFTEAPRCNVTPDIFEDYCYTSSTEGSNLFNS